MVASMSCHARALMTVKTDVPFPRFCAAGIVSSSTQFVCGTCGCENWHVGVHVLPMQSNDMSGGSSAMMLLILGGTAPL